MFIEGMFQIRTYFMHKNSIQEYVFCVQIRTGYDQCTVYLSKLVKYFWDMIKVDVECKQQHFMTNLVHLWLSQFWTSFVVHEFYLKHDVCTQGSHASAWEGMDTFSSTKLFLPLLWKLTGSYRSKTSHLCGLPESHKPKIPFRGIVTSPDSSCCALGEFLPKIVTPLAANRVPCKEFRRVHKRAPTIKIRAPLFVLTLSVRSRMYQ
jgi:hypothetical protein